MAVNLTLDEQEIIVSYSGRPDTFRVYTSYPHWMKKLDRYCEENPAQWKRTKEYWNEDRRVAASYEADRDLFTLRMKKRQVSEEQRKAAAERLAQYRASQEEDDGDSEE